MVRAYPYFAPARSIEPQRKQIVLPEFILSTPVWAGASGILQQASLVNDYKFSLRLPIEPFGENFIAAIRWMEDDIFARFVLFEHDDAVLSYPLYNGERIGENAVFEIWSVDSASAPVLDEAQVLETGILNLPYGEYAGVSQCENQTEVVTLTYDPPSSLPPGSACNPFCGDLCNTEPPMPVCECPITVVDTVALGRAYTPVVFISPALLVTNGGAFAGDTFGKTFRWDSASLAVDDGTIYTIVIRPNSLNALAPGRWLQTSLA